MRFICHIWRPAALRHVALWIAVLCVGTALTGISRAAPAAKPKPGPDLSTPKKAAAIFATAAEAGDMKALHLAAAGPEPQFAFVKTLGELLQAEKRYEAAAVKQFSDKGKLPPFMPAGLGEFVEASDESIEGAKASLINKADLKNEHPLALKKEGNNWKVDLGSIASPTMEKDAKNVKAMTDALNATAKEVEAGKYKTADEAIAAVGAAYWATLAPDRSTPKKAAVVFFKALEIDASSMAQPAPAPDVPYAATKGISEMFAALKRYETDTLHLTATGSDAQFATVRGIRDIYAAVKRYDAVAIKAFGNEGRLPFQISAAAAVEAFEEKVDGDNATLAMRVNPSHKPPIALHNDGGNWKVDLNSIDPETTAAGHAGKALADSIDAISRDVEAGKYKAAGDALAAMGQAMEAVMKAGAGGTLH